MTENYISKEGLEKIKKELEQLKTVDRPEVIERISRSMELGDLSENAEYHEARERQGFIEGRIQELESIVKNSIVIEGQRKSKIAIIGSTVHAICDNGQEMKYTIVGHSEADPSNGLISNESPIGQAFLGKTIGDEFELNVPAGKIKCKIKKVE